MKILEQFIKSGKAELHFSDFLNICEPITFAKSLRDSVDAGLVTVNWEEQLVKLSHSLSSLLDRRFMGIKAERIIPDYMQRETIDIDEPPYLK